MSLTAVWYGQWLLLLATSVTTYSIHRHTYTNCITARLAMCCLYSEVDYIISICVVCIYIYFKINSFVLEYSLNWHCTLISSLRVPWVSVLVLLRDSDILVIWIFVVWFKISEQSSHCQFSLHCIITAGLYRAWAVFESVRGVVNY